MVYTVPNSNGFQPGIVGTLIFNRTLWFVVIIIFIIIVRLVCPACRRST